MFSFFQLTEIFVIVISQKSSGDKIQVMNSIAATFLLRIWTLANTN